MDEAMARLYVIYEKWIVVCCIDLVWIEKTGKVSYHKNRIAHAILQIVDHETYFLNLTQANAENRAEWQLEYSARKDIPLEELTPRHWSNYVDRMAQNPAEFERFYT